MLLRLIERYLDPSESLLEILFGLIMALTLTAGARLLSDPAEIKPLELAAALAGCNVAWGIIDAVSTCWARATTAIAASCSCAACRRPPTKVRRAP